MSKTKIAGLLSALCAASMVAPAMAASGDSDAMDKVMQVSEFPVRVAGVGTGIVLGTPVAILRQSVHSYMQMTNPVADKIGGHDCGLSCGAASLVTIPASLVKGTVLGSYYGVKNGMVDGFSTPFNTSSFSLGSKYAE